MLVKVKKMIKLSAQVKQTKEKADKEWAEFYKRFGPPKFEVITW